MNEPELNWQKIPLPLLPQLLEKKIAQYIELNTNNGSSNSQAGSTKVAKKSKTKRKQSDVDDEDEALLFNGSLLATEFQSQWLAGHYPQMLASTNEWDSERKNYEKLLDVGTKLCRDGQFELANRCFSMVNNS